MIRKILPCGVAVAAMVLVGCVPYQKYQGVVDELAQAKRLNEDLVRKYHAELMKNKNRTIDPGTGDQAGRIAELMRQNQALQDQLAVKDLRFSEADRRLLDPGVEIDDEGSLVMTSDLLFPAGIARLKKGHLETLVSVANLLKSRYPNEVIVIEGHTDSDPLNRTKNLFEHNWNLGYERASSVFDYFRDQGVAKDQMILVSYGYMKPVAEGSTDDAKRQNRRVVIRRGGRKGVGGPLVRK